MKRLFILLSLLTISSAQEISVSLSHKQNSELVDLTAQLCAADKVGSGLDSPVNLGSTKFNDADTNKEKCSVLIDVDNQKTTDFDFIAASTYHQPTQIQTDGGNREGQILCVGSSDLSNQKCILYKVTLADGDSNNDVKYTKCEVNIQGMGSYDSNTDDTNNFHNVDSKITLRDLSDLDSIVPTFVNTGNTGVKFIDHGDGRKSCYFMPVNNKYVGAVDVVVRFEKADASDPQKYVQIKIPVKFIPHLAEQLGVSGRDLDVSNQHDAMVLMAKSNVNNQKDDKCKALDGVDFIGIRRSDNTNEVGADCVSGDMTQGHDDCSTKEILLPGQTIQALNTRSTGNGCKTTGSLPYLFTNGIQNGIETVTLNEKLNPSYSNILSAEGTAVKTRVMAHFVDKRYKVIDQSGVETLKDNIGNFHIATQSLHIASEYLNVGHTRKTIQTTGLDLKKLNKDDYASSCLQQAQSTSQSTAANADYDAVAPDDTHLVQNVVQSGGCTDIDNQDYAQYYFDHDHVVAYENIKHVQNTYITAGGTCGSEGCSNSFIVSGFNGEVIIKIPVDKDASVPKAPWNVYIPKLTIRSIGDASVLKLSSDAKSPTYGLPVLDTSKEPQFSNGYPLSHFFEVQSVEDCEIKTGNNAGKADVTKCDEVDSYDDRYELFHRLTVVESNANNLQEFWKDITAGTEATTTMCSSNRATSDNGVYSEGKVRDIGVVYRDVNGEVSGSYLTQAQTMFQHCRLKITDNIQNNGKDNYLEQVIMSWNNVEDARMCQSDTTTALTTGMVYCNGFTAPVRSTITNYDSGTDSCTRCSKLTIIDRRKVMIGSTELSLLRRQEIFSGQGVTVQGANIVFLLGKENGGDTSADVLEFDIWGTHSLQGYKNDATRCESGDVTQSNNVGPICEEIHGCTEANGLFGLAETGYDEECAEKKVKTPRQDGEFTLHTIRSTVNCNGKLDIQLRLRQSGDDDDTNKKIWNTENLLLDSSTSGFLRPVYDVRLPCSRITQSTSDSIHLKFKFDLTYDLSDNSYSLSTEGVSQLNGQDLSFNGNAWSSQENINASGFTKIISYKSIASSSEICSVQTYDNVFNDPFANSCSSWSSDSTGKSISTVDGDTTACNIQLIGTNDQLTNTVYLGMIYKRTYSYKVDRDHLLDTQVANTEITAEDTYFCQEQKFQLSVNAKKTASVSVVTPVQLIVERKAEVVQIEWHGDNAANSGIFSGFDVCGNNQYQLRVVIQLEEQGTHSTNNNQGDFVYIQDPSYSLAINSNSDGLTVHKVSSVTSCTDGTSTDKTTCESQSHCTDTSITVETTCNEQGESWVPHTWVQGTSYAVLTSSCVQVTANDCTGELDSDWKSLSQTSTGIILEGLDNVLHSSASGTNIVSNINIETNFESCPVDPDPVEVSDEFAVALSFDTNNAGNCLTVESDKQITAINNNQGAIKNCGSALVTATGVASLHGYIVASGNEVLTQESGQYVANYIDGALSVATSGMMVDTAVFSLKRYERNFDGSKGSQIGDAIELCKRESNGNLQRVVCDAAADNCVDEGGTGRAALTSTFGTEANLHTAVDGDYKCKFDFAAFGEADLIQDLFEVEVEVLFKNSARRLRASKELKLGSVDSSIAGVGFEVVSDTTTVSEETQASAVVEPQQPQSSEPVHHKEGEFDFGILALIIFGVLAGLAFLYWLMQYMNRKGYKKLATNIKVDNPGMPLRFNNLRY